MDASGKEIDGPEWTDSPEEAELERRPFEQKDHPAEGAKLPLEGTESKPPEKHPFTFTQRNEQFSNRLVSSFLPFKWLMISLGRFPLTSKKLDDASHLYEWNWLHPNALYFVGVTVIMFYILIVGSWDMFAVLVDVKIANKGNETTAFIYEKALLQRHMVLLIIIWTSLAHLVLTSVTVIWKREYMAKYFTFWTKVVQTLHMDVAEGLLCETIAITIGYTFTITVLVFLSMFQATPASTSAPTIMGILMFREYFEPLYGVNTTVTFLFDPSLTTSSPNAPTPDPIPIEHYEILDQDPGTLTAIRIIGGFFLLLIYATSKVYMFVFIYYCKLLKSGFAHWNGRLYAAILKGGKAFGSAEGRTTFKILFRDHCLLLDLMEGTDELFTGILESYFLLQTSSCCYELYFIIRAIKYGTDQEGGAQDGGQFFIRPNDWAPAIIVFLLSMIILFLAVLAATDVGDEASAGLEVLRRRPLVGRQTDEELYFTLSMYTSYTCQKKLAISGAGFFVINQEFLVLVLSTVLTYFIILYQFQPTLDHKTKGDFKLREIIGKYLTNAEGLHPEDHYLFETFENTPLPQPQP